MPAADIRILVLALCTAGDVQFDGVEGPGKPTGTLTCWGSNQYGQSAPPSGTFTTVSAGQFHSCGVRSDGTVACWGDPPGTIDQGQATVPAGTFSTLAASAEYTCGLRPDGSATCWGREAATARSPDANIEKTSVRAALAAGSSGPGSRRASVGQSTPNRLTNSACSRVSTAFSQ